MASGKLNKLLPRGWHYSIEFENNIITELQELVSDDKYKSGSLEELNPKYLNIPESKEGPCHSLLTLDVVAVGRTGILYDVIIKK